MKTLWFLQYSNTWELIAGLSISVLIFIAYIPSIVALYYVIRNKMWLAIIPELFTLSIPILGNLIGISIILEQELGLFKSRYLEIPLWARCVVLIPANLLLISLTMMVWQN